eukprot:1067170-Rhodomonas_salina.1
MKPDGVRFAVPVTLSIPVNVTTVAAEQASGNEVNMAFLNTTTGQWEILSSSIDQITGLISVETTHFSQWTAMSVSAISGSVSPVAEDSNGGDDGGWASWFWPVIATSIAVGVLLWAVVGWYFMKER